jgi:uncharacterized protein (DUF1684 family)
MTSEFDSARYIRAVEEFRRGKDEDFGAAVDSPIPARDRATFPGLRYFPPDPVLRVIAAVERVEGGRALRMQTSDGRERDYERAAVLRFTVDGQEQRLTAYRTPDGDEDEPYFIPFRDAQAGKETYGAGRYLEVRAPHSHGGEPRQVTLDFNLAYNPYCAYNEAYSCPIPPAENTLPIAIRAGEMTYAEH